MTPGWWKLAAVCGAAIWLSLAGYWLKGVVEEAGQAEVLRGQIKANLEAQDKINTVARAAETQLASERRKAAELNRKWKVIRETESHAVCTLDDDTLGLLRDATGPAGVLPR